MNRLLLPLLLVATGSVAADVIHLRHGRTLRGKIVRETHDALVLRTPQGEIVVRRSTVDRVEEESAAELYLGQARDAVRDQDYGIARQHFALALEELDARDPLREQVEAELAAVKRRSDPYLRKSAGAARWAQLGPDPFAREEPEARVRELMAGAEVRADLRGQLV
ncbi:MAG: hypothetical protein KDD82_10235, partial [Planctomycetes bacterium]|nr:hypothetical protein [Planctomycetota bacterium]